LLPALALAAVAAAAATGSHADAPSVRVAGSAQVVYDWSRQQCSQDDIPDLPARALRGPRGRVEIVLSDDVNRRLIGRSFDHLLHPCGVVMGSHANADASAFADREWIASVYSFGGRWVVALIHDEYHGWQHPDGCRSRVSFSCWYNAITLAVSRDGGASFQDLPPPRNVVAASPLRYRSGSGPTGLFAPSNIVRNPADGYFYALVRVRGPGSVPRGTCVLRATRLDDGRAWRAWNGESFSLSMQSPYSSRGASGGFCQPVSPAEISEMDESLTFNSVTKSFLLVGMAGAYDPLRRRIVWGVYYSFSRDLINWSPRQLLFEATTVHNYRCGDPKPVDYPSVIDPSSRSPVFETSGARAYVYFTHFNYSRCKMTFDRDLVRVPIEVQP
jgi:hypothetical protein